MKQSHEATADSLGGGGTLSGAAPDRQTGAVNRPRLFSPRGEEPHGRRRCILVTRLVVLWHEEAPPVARSNASATVNATHKVGFNANVSRDGERRSEEPALELAYVSSSEVHDHCAADNGLDRTTAEKFDPADDGSGQPGQQLDQGRLVLGLERNVGRRASARQTRTAHQVRGSLDSKYADTVSAVKVDYETDKQRDEATIRCRYTLKRGPRTEG